MPQIINVAIAILHFGEQYLLGYRNASQHQGEKYEFIGGKIESGESPKQGLIREVMEEIGCDISANIAVKMGVIRHDYSDKSVALHCFKIEITEAQFNQLQREIGTEGQAITWVQKSDLLAKKYPLPDANARILDWLTLPDTIFISQSLDKFASTDDWIIFYTTNLPQNAMFYIRPQADNKQNIELINGLLSLRGDILPIIQYDTFTKTDLNVGWVSDSVTHRPEKSHINGGLRLKRQANPPSNSYIIHLNHHQLTTLNFNELPKDLTYFASCHDKNSLSKLNNLAKTHTVMGGFLSPVLATPTHPNSEVLGWEKFSNLAQMADFPVFALGGMTLDNLPKVWQQHGFGIAGIRLLIK